WLGAGWQEDADGILPFLLVLNPYWLIVDHYALDSRWETATSQHWQRLLVIDDLADRAHIADLLLDQNLGRAASDYKPLLPGHAQCLVGPQYALLRPEFAEFRPYSLERRKSGELRHILISLGGVDKDNATGAVLRALRECPLPADCTMTVIMGGHAPHLQDVRTVAATMPWATEVAINVSDMAKRMSEADLAIGAAGSTSWERCCLGLPTLMLVLADNQYGIAKHLHAYGASITVGQTTQQGWDKRLADSLSTLDSLATRSLMIHASAQLTSGQGANLLADSLIRNRSV
ncbi:MAG: UDP-2,4-diacetamido-2,4,6-trideoxy-beta-L-altropyranose hydrolase, partial [Salinicola sp.]|uniref:UDP-2,4-diacetamido-2,4, 6-trideoxy-beta-L-altropyranose hydrolase n=1 Tax=Salinicola sp. TaxID=1978524 RepID=UPI001E13A620